MSHEDDDRFGMPDSAFESARDVHQGIHRSGMHVPTRLEVRTMPTEQLSIVIDLWMSEGPVELIPSYQQIRDVIDELNQRPDLDTAEVAKLIAICKAYVGES